MMGGGGSGVALSPSIGKRLKTAPGSSLSLTPPPAPPAAALPPPLLAGGVMREAASDSLGSHAPHSTTTNKDNGCTTMIYK